jgi:hypothetical protein
MNTRHDPRAELFRLWIVRYDDWQPTHWNDWPTRAAAVRPIEETVYSAEEAALLLEGFNSWILENISRESEDRHWAIAVPVRIRYEGDAVEGEIVIGD